MDPLVSTVLLGRGEIQASAVQREKKDSREREETEVSVGLMDNLDHLASQETEERKEILEIEVLRVQQDKLVFRVQGDHQETLAQQGLAVHLVLMD